MSEKKKRRVVKNAKPETVRERAAKAQTEKPKKQRVRTGISKVTRPIGKLLAKVFAFIKKVLSPFSFILKPFKTKPARAVGRFLAKVLLINYFKKSWQELRKVEWPNRRQTFNLTIAVFLFAIGLTSIVAGTDWVLDKLFRELLLR